MNTLERVYSLNSHADLKEVVIQKKKKFFLFALKS
jgi:hypothetical protein